MKIQIALIALFSTVTAFASFDRVMSLAAGSLEYSLKFDEKTASWPAPWLYRSRSDFYQIQNPKSAISWESCGHFRVIAKGPFEKDEDFLRNISNPFGASEVKFIRYPAPNGKGAYTCAFTPVAVDFEERELYALLDMVADGVPMVRYLAAISGDVVDFMSALKPVKPNAARGIDSLAAAITQLSRGKTSFGQWRHFDGILKIRRSSKMKRDPHGVMKEQTKKPEDRRLIFFGENDKLETVEYDVVGSGLDTQTHASPALLAEALEQTTAILKEGHAKLSVESDAKSIEEFRKHIAANGKTISGELGAAMRLMREKNFHPMELIHFVNNLSDLIASIDSILKNDSGSNATLEELIR